MSYVVTIRRPDHAAPLSAGDVERLLRKDSTLNRAEADVLVWRQSETSPPLYINVEADHLWTDGVTGDATDACLSKLRDIARVLEAELPELEARLEAAGAPWTPGRKLPVP